MTRFIAIIALAAGITGCATVRPENIQAEGTRIYAAPPADVVPAVVAALNVMGFEIATLAADGSVIKTKRRPIAMNGGGGIYFHQWTIRIDRTGSTAHVTATPHMFDGDYEYGSLDLEYWRQRWAELYREIDESLAMTGRTDSLTHTL